MQVVEHPILIFDADGVTSVTSYCARYDKQHGETITMKNKTTSANRTRGVLKNFMFVLLPDESISQRRGRSPMWGWLEHCFEVSRYLRTYDPLMGTFSICFEIYNRIRDKVVCSRDHNPIAVAGHFDYFVADLLSVLFSIMWTHYYGPEMFHGCFLSLSSEKTNLFSLSSPLRVLLWVSSPYIPEQRR